MVNNPTEAPMANAIDDVKEWVLVPKEPTEAMYNAGYDATRKPDGFPQFADAGFVLGHSGTIYSAMLAAAPPSPAPSQHTGWSDEAVEAAAEVIWNDQHARYAALWHTRKRDEVVVIQTLATARAALTSASSIAPATGFEPQHIDTDHDGFSGDVIGSYVTREGKRGFVVQQDGTRVVHVYGEKFASISPSVAKESGEP